MRQGTHLHVGPTHSVSTAAQRAPARSVRTPKPGCYRSITSGLPAESKQNPKRVNFDPPRLARCLSTDGNWSTDCEVLTVWESGARLRSKEPSRLDEFLLQFAWSPTVVSRRCRRVWCRGEEVCVDYVRKRASYSMERDL
jgi:hypothetical protein